VFKFAPLRNVVENLPKLEVHTFIERRVCSDERQTIPDQPNSLKERVNGRGVSNEGGWRLVSTGKPFERCFFVVCDFPRPICLRLFTALHSDVLGLARRAP